MWSRRSLQRRVAPPHAVLIAAADGLALAAAAVLVAVILRQLEHSWVLCLPFARYYVKACSYIYVPSIKRKKKEKGKRKAKK